MADLFVSSAAAGGGSGTPASPYTRDEAHGVAVAGDTIWVKADGDYPSTHAVAAFTNSGTGTAAIYVIAYTTTPGDGGTASYSGSINWGPGGGVVVWSGIDFNVNTTTACLSPAEDNSFLHCKIRNTGAGRPFNANNLNLVGCYLEGGEGARGGGLNLHATKIKLNGNGTGTYVLETLFGCSASQLLLVGTGTSIGIRIASQSFEYCPIKIAGCIVYDCSDGIDLSGAADGRRPVTIVDNVIYTCSGYGINYNAGDAGHVLIGNNAIGNCTSGRVSLNGAIELDGITLTADPFTDAANGDFSLNNAAGGGALCRGAGLVPLAA